MKKSRVRKSLIAGLAAFLFTFFITFLIESPHPFWASLIVAFLIFEICYYFYFHREKREEGL